MTPHLRSPFSVLFPYYFLPVLIIITFTMSLHAQGTLITPIDWEEFETPNGKQDLLDGILSNSIYDTVIPVTVDYLPDFQIDGLLSFELPGIEDTIYAFA